MSEDGRLLQFRLGGSFLNRASLVEFSVRPKWISICHTSLASISAAAVAGSAVGGEDETRRSSRVRRNTRSARELLGMSPAKASPAKQLSKDDG